jgi:diacylglycerol O-acyltransferase
MSERMSNADNFWLCMDEPANLMIITGFMEFERPLDFNRLYATIESRLASFPRFQQKVVLPKTGMGVPSWKHDDHYDLRSHLQRVALPAPGDKTELQEMIANLSVTPLDPNKPLWQVHLIENYGKGCVLFFRIHHCITDGIAGIYVLLSTADTEPDAPWPKAAPKKKQEPFSVGALLPVDAVVKRAKKAIAATQSLGRQARKELDRAIKDPSHLQRLVKASSCVPTDFASVLSKYMLMSSDPNTAFKGKLGVRKRVAWTEPMSLDNIKRWDAPSAPPPSTTCSSPRSPGPCVDI